VHAARSLQGRPAAASRALGKRRAGPNVSDFQLSGAFVSSTSRPLRNFGGRIGA
jgi:hypothetical protein